MVRAAGHPCGLSQGKGHPSTLVIPSFPKKIVESKYSALHADLDIITMLFQVQLWECDLHEVMQYSYLTHGIINGD